MNGSNVILNSLKTEPQRWTVDRFWAKHDSGLAIWIGNGCFSCRIEKPEYQEFGLLDRIKLYRAIKQFHK